MRACSTSHKLWAATGPQVASITNPTVINRDIDRNTILVAQRFEISVLSRALNARSGEIVMLGLRDIRKSDSTVAMASILGADSGAAAKKSE
jgi:hypothetical protein